MNLFTMNKAAISSLTLNDNHSRLDSRMDAICPSSTSVLYGIKKTFWLYRIRLSLLKILVSVYPDPRDWVYGLLFLIKLRKRFNGKFKMKKMVSVDGKKYLGLYTPGYNDWVFRKFVLTELENYKPVNHDTLRFNHVHLAITNKCALRCDHCYAWDILNHKDTLDDSQVLMIVERLKNMGTGQIHLTGGEPMLKFNLICNILEKGTQEVNFWINTSGFGLSSDRAKKLKAHGLTGVFISLDHYTENLHNDFRKHSDSYKMALKGAKNAIDNGLVVAFSICVTNEFISVKNLMAYLELAKNIGVHFVQILEPRSVGHFNGKDVSLTKENICVLESFYERYNFTNDFLDFPIINYHGYYQRREGCQASGKKGIYVDSEGYINACPFCHNKSGNILDEDFLDYVDVMSPNNCSLK